MDDQDKANHDTEKPAASAPQLEGVKPNDAEATGPATAQQLTEVEQQMSGFEKATLRWARTAVILSGVAALFVCAQWWEMHEGGIDTHNLAIAANNQATWTQRLAGATESSVTQAGKALDASIDTARTDQRAWVGITDISIRVLKPNARFVYIGYLQNSGKTPAINVSFIFTKYRTFLKAETPAFHYERPDGSRGIFTLQPAMKISFSGFENPGDEPLSPKQVDAISTGVTTLCIYGKVAYEDIFKVRHYTHFCVWVDRNLEYTHPCARYNDTDHNGENPPHPN